MPLLDHFRAPLYPLHPWESFHTFWIAAIGEGLNRSLPQRYFAVVQTHLGMAVEADMAEFEGEEGAEEELSDGQGGGVAVQAYAPPAATMTLPAYFPDVFEVQVIDRREGARLVAVVELVSPGNKDRSEARRAFAAKCGAYLQRGIGLVAADIVTSRQANLHDEMATMMGLGPEYAMPAQTYLYATAYRPVRRQGQDLIDVWAAPLAVGSALPTLPLALLGAGPIPLDLEASYADACQRSRL
jgi:hypothetical protein